MPLTIVNRCLVLLIAVVAVSISSCASVRDGAPANYTKQWYEIPDAVPTPVTPSKYGNPDSYEVMGETYYVMDVKDEFEQKGIASWYGNKFHGRRTSSGEPYDMYAMTAAHKTLRIPVYVEVSNIDNGRKAIVKVNDRGPFHEGRIIDLSYAAATKLGVAQAGTANVKIRVIGADSGYGITTSSDEKQGASGKPVTPPVAPPASSAKAQSATPSVMASGDKVYVQVAVFSSEKNALKHMDQLKDQGFFDVRLHVEQKKQSALYRVRIGPLPSERVAKNISAQLKENNHQNTKIVTNN